jgi:hypothetical protein
VKGKGKAMLHIGHFSFDAIDEEDNVRHGHFTCIVDADDAEVALTGFSGQIARMHNSEASFADMVKVYLEDIIQMEILPDEPVVTLVHNSKGPFPPSVSTSLPEVDSSRISAFGLSSNVQRNESIQGDDGYIETDPLITFDRHQPSVGG